MSFVQMTKWHLVFLHAVAEFYASQHQRVVFFWLFVNTAELQCFALVRCLKPMIYSPLCVFTPFDAKARSPLPVCASFSTIKLCRRATVTSEHLRAPQTVRRRQLHVPKRPHVAPLLSHKTGPQSCSSPTNQNSLDLPKLQIWHHLYRNLILLCIKSCCWLNCMVFVCQTHPGPLVPAHHYHSLPPYCCWTLPQKHPILSESQSVWGCRTQLAIKQRELQPALHNICPARCVK